MIGNEITTIMAMPLGDVTAFMRQIASAPDLERALSVLKQLAIRCLPEETRVDLLFEEHDGTYRQIFSTEDASEHDCTVTYCSLLDTTRTMIDAGRSAVITVPLEGPNRRMGWLIVAQQNGIFEPETAALADQIAALLTLRLYAEYERAERKASQDYMATLQHRLLSADEVRLRATLAAGAAHDIGNLLASVMGHIQLMQQYAPKSLQSDLRTIEQAARDGHHLLRRVLSSRLTVSESPSIPRAGIRQVIADALKITEPFWDERQTIAIVTDVPLLPPVATHPTDLREVLINLIMNGITAMAQGGTLTIRAHLVGSAVAIEVHDTGVGIEQAFQETIFQPVLSARNTNQGGSGLGLSVSRAIIEEYGGTLDVSSAVGAGATFTIILPTVR
jgi:signal transduction histidine kinase